MMNWPRRSAVDNDSDDDSVPTDYTEEEEYRSDDEWPVERILAEKEGQDGSQFFLVKWEGYELKDCTWEPTEHLDSCKPALEDWLIQKKRIDRFGQQKFDVEAWEREKDEQAAKKERRDLRRMRKRLKKGMWIRESQDEQMPDANFEDEWPSRGSSPDVPIRSIRRRKTTFDTTLGGFIVDDDEDGLVPTNRKRSYRDRKASSGEDDDFPTKSPLEKGVESLRLRKKSRSEESSARPLTSKSTTLKKQPTNSTLMTKPTLPRLNTDQLRFSKVRPDLSSIKRTDSTNQAKNVNMAKRTVPGKLRKTGAALFANMFKPKQIRRPRVNPNVRHDEKARKFTTLSERWRYETYGRTEPAPNLDDLIYPDKPKTSGSILKKGIAITDSPSTRPTTPEGQNTDELKGTTSLGQFNPSEALSRQFSTHNSTPTPPNEEPSPIESMNSDPISRSSKIPFTCYFWYYGKCKDPKCRYLHNENSSSMGSQSKAELSIPKYLPRPLTCYFWYFTGVCNRSAAACTYAHWNTGFVGNLDKAKGPIEVSTELSRAPNTLEEVTKGSGAPQIGNYNLMHNFSPKNSVTCFFWKFGYCSNFRANRPCAYAHQDCYLVANPPGIFQPRTDPDKLLLERQKVATGKPFLNPDFGVRGSCLSDEALDWPAPHLSVNNSAVHSRSRILSPPAQSREHDIMIDFEEVGIGVILTINTGNGTTDLPIMLMNNSPDARERLVIEIGASGKLIIDSICLTDDFESYGYDDDETSTFGYILPTKESRRIFQTYAESLMTHNTAAVVFHKSFTMIIYPAHVEKRKYLDSVCDFPEQALLRYYVRSPIQSHRINRQTIELDTSTNGETIIQRIFDINPEKIFKGTTPQPLEKNVFLMIPSFQEVELDLLTRVFLSMDAVVYRLQAPGSWTQFGKKTRSGVIIIHPDITEYSAIPQLDFRFLGRQYEFFRLGYDPHAENLQVQPNYKLISLFPNGRVICITDDVFVDYRSEALRIVKYFVKEDALKAQGFKNRKFAGRPGLLPWMFDRIFEEPQDPIIAETYQELEKLAPPQLQVKSSPLNPGPLASLVSERVEFWPAYPEMWKKDRTKATECLVEWFAGWACCEVTNFRRFIVVHTVDKPNWRKQYQHLHFFSLSGFLEAHGIK